MRLQSPVEQVMHRYGIHCQFNFAVTNFLYDKYFKWIVVTSQVFYVTCVWIVENLLVGELKFVRPIPLGLCSVYLLLDW